MATVEFAVVLVVTVGVVVVVAVGVVVVVVVEVGVVVVVVVVVVWGVASGVVSVGFGVAVSVTEEVDWDTSAFTVVEQDVRVPVIKESATIEAISVVKFFFILFLRFNYI